MKNTDNLKYHYSNMIEKTLGIKLEKDASWDFILAGGCLRDYLVNEKIKDIDVFPKNQAGQDFIISKLKEKGKLMSENARLSNYTVNGKWFQVVKGQFYDSPEALINNFDYTICCIGYDGKDLSTHENFFEDLACKRLRTNTLTFPLSSLERIQKYIKKGYTACNGTMLSLAKAVATVNFESNDENRLEFYPDGSPRFMGID